MIYVLAMALPITVAVILIGDPHPLKAVWLLCVAAVLAWVSYEEANEQENYSERQGRS